MGEQGIAVTTRRFTSDNALDGLTVETLEGLLTKLDELPNWTNKVQCRRKGYSLHVSWSDEEERDVQVAMAHQHWLQESPALLTDAIERLLAIIDTDENGSQDDSYSHGHCICGGPLDPNGTCVDRCARDSYDR